MSEQLDRVLAALAAHGCPATRSGEGWSSRCPHHEDHRPSLITSDGDKAVVMHCHVQCSTEDIVADIGLTMADLFYEAPKKGLGEIEQTWDYRNEDGRLVYQVVKFAGKQFRQRRPGGQPPGDGWVWNLKGVPPVLYRLPELLDEISLGSTIYVTEGEKDADAIVAAGGVATCNSGGAGKWRPEFGRILSNAEHVRICADKDEPGYAHADDVAASLNGTSHEILVARYGKDPADHLTRHGLEDFLPREVAGPVSDPAATEPASDSAARKIVPHVRISSMRGYRPAHVIWLPGFEGFIPIGMCSLLAGVAGTGKSMFGVYLAAAASARGDDVVIAAAEDSIPHTLLPRLMAMGARPEHVHFAQYADDHGDGALHLPDHEHLLRDAIEECRPKLLILDPIGSFMGRAINVWKDSEVRDALGPLKYLAEENMLALLMLAHLNKGVGAPFLDRISNSGAFSQLVRSAMLWGIDPDDPEGEDGYRRVLVSGKLNVGHRPAGQVFEIHPTSVQDEDETYGTARLQWVEESKHSTSELLARREPKPPGPALASAITMLQEVLADGQMPAAWVEERARTWPDPISRATLYRAAERVGVEHVTLGYQKGSAWKLP